MTAEDVASSLYYIHLDTSKPDPAPPTPPKHDTLGPSSEEASPTKSIPRKPLPGGARPTSPEKPPPPPALSPGKENRPAVHPRKPVRSAERPLLTLELPNSGIPLDDSGVGFSDSEDSPAPPPNPPRPPAHTPLLKPLGARALPRSNNLPGSGAGKTLPDPPREEPFSSSQLPYSSYYDEPISRSRMTVEQPRPRSHGDDLGNAIAGEGNPRPRPLSLAHLPQFGRPVPSRTLPPKNETEPFTLRLIRRDPSSGSQWNVGRISSHLPDTSMARLDEGSPVPRPSIDIVIETSGYAKFRNMPVRKGVDASAPQSVPRRSTLQSERGMFSRQVVMSYSKSWSSALRQRINRLDKASLGQRRPHSRNISVDSTLSAFSMAGDSGPVSFEGDPGPGMKPRGYVFSSPWDGRCEFRTGNGGRSVRCHHILHEGPAAAYNPLVAEQQSAAGSAPPSDAAPMVSELRFNLPSAELIAPAEQAAARHRLGNLRRFWKREDDDGDESDDEVSPFDVNLGREHAGGGNRGKRAKLGKLIVTYEGLKMLDLIVAANLGIWWGAWERSF